MDIAKQGLGRIITKIAIITWSLWVILDYVVHHPYLTKALTTLPYFELLLSGLVLGGIAGFLVNKKIKSNPGSTYTTSYRGIWVYLLVQILASVLIVAFSANSFMPKLASSMRIGYFFYLGTAYFLGLLFIVTSAFAAGNAAWKYLFRTKTPIALIEKSKLLKIALGFSVLGTLLVIVGQLGLFKVYVLWPILVAVIGWQWKATWHFIRDLVWTRKTLEIRSWWVPLLLLVILTVVAFNWIAAFKVFPIGYDGSSLYVNTAMLVAGNGYLPAGGQAYNWSVMMGLGQALFDNVVFAILLSHLMNVFCLLMLYRLARLWLSADVALLASAAFLLSPYVAFHGIIDEKVDLALAFMVLASFYPLAAQTRNADENEKALSFPLGIIILSGWLAGYAFGIKYTAIMYVLALASWFFYFRGGKLPFFGAFFTIMSFVFLAEIYRFGYLDIYTSEARLLGGGLGVIGLGIFYFAYRSGFKRLLVPIKQLAILGGVFLLPFLPWSVKHLAENQTFSIGAIVEGKAASPKITIVPLSSLYAPGMDSGNFLSYQDKWSDLPTNGKAGQRILPPFIHATKNLDQDQGQNATSSGAREEIQRYLGYEDELWRYASLPYDLAMNTNVPNNRYLDIGYLYLLLLPLLLLVSRRGNRPWWMKGALVAVTLCFLALAYISIFSQGEQVFDLEIAQQQAMAIFQQHSGGTTSILAIVYGLLVAPILWLANLLTPVYYAGAQLTTMGAMLVLVAVYGLFYALLRNRLGNLPKSFVGFGAFLSVYSFIWWVMGNGIIWYALPLFVAFPIFLLFWFEHPQRLLGATDVKFSRLFLGVVVGLSLFFNTALYFTSAFPEDNSGSPLFRWPFVDYISNPTAQKQKVINYFNPVLSETTRLMNADKKAKIYRVNTHYGYLIEQNDTRVFSDPTLEKFDEISSQYNDESMFFDQLKAQGYRYIFFDIKTGAMDQTPEQSLQKKFIRLANLLVSSNKVLLLLTDNYVADDNYPNARLPNGQRANARPALIGKTIYLGNIALFEIQ